MEKIVYLGDGLYAKRNPLGIVLMTNSPTQPTDVVYIELPDVWEALQKYVRRVIEQNAKEAHHETE